MRMSRGVLCAMRLLAMPAFVCGVDIAQAQSVGRLRGVIFDSLNNRPLARATVTVSGSPRFSMTDARGRFDIDSISLGAHFLSFSSPSLDSLGLFNLGRNVKVTESINATVTLATPSFATLWKVHCAQTHTLKSDSGIVYGEIINAANDERLDGARISLSWWALENSGKVISLERMAIVVKSDSAGTYRACGLPVDVTLSVDIDAGRMVAAETEMQLGAARTTRRDYFVSGELRAHPSDSATRLTERADTSLVSSATKLRGTSTLRGLVRDQRGVPIGGALMTVPSADTSARTDEHGRFTLGQLPAGTQSVRLLRVGYGPIISQVDLRPGQALDLVLDLTASRELAKVNVVADRRINFAQRAFADRRRVGWGYFMSGRQLTDSYDIMSALQSVPSVRVYRSGFEGGVMIGGGFNACKPDLFIDGRVVSIEEFQFYQTKELFGIEVYTTPSSVPPQFATSSSLRQDRRCGVIVAWTKYAR